MVRRIIIWKRREILIALRAVVIESVAEGLSCTAVTITLALAGKRRLGASYFCFLTSIIYRSAKKISRFARNDDTGVCCLLIFSLPVTRGFSSSCSNLDSPFPVSSSKALPRDLSCTAVTVTLALAGKRRLGASYFCFLTSIIYRSAKKISRFARNDDTGV